MNKWGKQITRENVIKHVKKGTSNARAIDNYTVRRPLEILIGDLQVDTLQENTT